MFPDQKEDWLREVTDICTTTLDILNDKVETEGRISTAEIGRASWRERV